ncbi:SET domain-containing protein 4 isoform X1 [Ahaetulla prasina]|uniref:SET domain-containing protein 4 isoform X1 n=1 Tax=Ahaetulla prasina TaxID=499056 RepID=UPI0026479243|nr:SET domain-containing protein 4 isoform X1 [Ahaetulla prasina]XP_058042852.1 SET domain-containing protein 4 isoform X1 [Ahaetulla prasina]XP_058042853.1 SET domain-containing protein 4 isoform X1 [Ahaetulla prasina]XP_058042854.1 SET domain-containing protein 4 isoform X1 [Ahaetulla prasina]
MKKGRGRTYRKRHRKQSTAFSSSVNLSYKNEYILLKKWLKEKGYKNNNLNPALFSETGRGLMTTKTLQAEELIISLPEKCLLTSNTVLNSYLGEYILKWRPPISPLIALCSFLIAEKWFHRKSVWKPYLDLLPETYTCPVYLEQVTLNLFPEPLRRKAVDQLLFIHDLFTSSKQFFSSLQPLFSEDVEIIFNFSAFQWAWCTINTRTVFMKHSQKDCFSREPDIYALAPFLDLLNHNPKAQVKASFNENTKCYEIKTHLGYQKYKEVYICYGPHDNQRLLLQYGFVASDNPHSCVHVSTDTLLKYVYSEDKQKSTKLSILREHKMLDDLTFGWDGPSWTLLTALKLLCLEADEFSLWKKVVLGDVASRKNEEKSVAFATKICTSLMEETQHVLQKVSDLKNHDEQLVNQLTLVEALHTENLRILQLSYEILQHLLSTTI